ncbi:prolyl oligopeptidase family serine peptidase, partial [Streptomyces aureus]
MTQSPPRDAGPSPASYAYPPAPRSGPVEVVHGLRVADPYRWLEDSRDPATIAWCEAQDRLYTEEESRWPDRDRLLARMTALLAGGGARPPVARGGREFHVRREPGRELAALAVREGDRTRTLLDPLDADPSGTTVLDAWEPSWEGDLVAVQLSSGGTEHSVLRVLDTTTGETVDGPVDRVRRSPMAWLPGGRAFYYVRRLPSGPGEGGGPPPPLWRVQVGTAAPPGVV